MVSIFSFGLTQESRSPLGQPLPTLCLILKCSWMPPSHLKLMNRPSLMTTWPLLSPLPCPLPRPLLCPPPRALYLRPQSQLHHAVSHLLCPQQRSPLLTFPLRVKRYPPTWRRMRSPKPRSGRRNGRTGIGQSVGKPNHMRWATHHTGNPLRGRFINTSRPPTPLRPTSPSRKLTWRRLRISASGNISRRRILLWRSWWVRTQSLGSV